MSVTEPGGTLQVDIVGGQRLSEIRAGENRPPELISPFRLFEVLWRRKGTIFVVSLLVLAMAIPLILQIPPRYETRSLVLVDTRKNMLSDLQAIASGAQSDAIEVRTQVDILRSFALAEQVATRIDLIREPEFADAIANKPTGIGALIAAAEAFLGYVRPPAPPMTDSQKIRAATNLLLGDKVSVVNDGRSYVIAIVAKTQDPELSARIANTFARVYLDFNRELKDRAVTRTNAWLDERMAPLQQKLRNAEREVANFREAHGLIGDGASGAGGERQGTVIAQQLAQLNTQMIQATADRVQKEAALDDIKRALAGGGDIFSIPAVVASPVIQRLRAQEAEVGARLASLGLTQSSASPSLMAARAEQKDIHARILQEAQKVTASMQNEASAARIREAALKAGLNTLQAQVAEQGKSEIRLHELQGEADAARSVYVDYLNRAEHTTNERDIQQPDAELISLASVPLSQSPPTTRQYLFVALLAAGLAGVIAGLIRDRLEPGFRTAEQLEIETGLAALGFLPRARRRKAALAMDGRDIAYVEAMSNVRSVLQCAEVAGHPRVILVTSAVPKEGKTFFALSMARSFALAGGRSLLIDCDLRRPSVATTVGIAAEPGMRSLGETSTSGDIAPLAGIDQLIQRDNASQLDIITAADAPGSAPTMVSSDQLRALVDEARSRYDLVVIDSPPVLAFVDARVLSQIADSTVLVVRWRKTPRAMVRSAIKALRTYNGRLAGAVITQVNMSALGASEGSHAYMLRKYGSYFR